MTKKKKVISYSPLFNLNFLTFRDDILYTMIKIVNRSGETPCI